MATTPFHCTETRDYCQTSVDCITQRKCIKRAERIGTMVAEAGIVHPQHYNRGIECWDYIVSHELGFLEGNIIKYVTRYRDKGGVKDLHKAREYLDRLIKELEK